MGFLSFTGKQGRMLPRWEWGHRSAFRTPIFGNSVMEDMFSDPMFFLRGLIQFILVAPLRRAGSRGSPAASASKLPWEGERTGEAGISQGWGRGLILQAAAGKAPTASANYCGCSCFCSSPGAGLSHLAKPASPRQRDRVHPVPVSGGQVGARQGPPCGCREGGGHGGGDAR